MRRTKVCSRPGCPNLQPCPIEGHTRPTNARWSKDRDGAQQNRFRKIVLDRDNYRCVRCGATTDLVAHHVKPGYDAASGTTLCRDCHKRVDNNAR